MPSTIQEILETLSGQKLNLRINNNRSTMLSIRWDPECARISMHRMFLEAPPDVIHELAHYIKFGQRQPLPISIKKYIENRSMDMDYSNTVDKGALVTAGECFDLKDIYDCLNESYFDRQLDLSITWYGNPKRRMRSRINFGLYSYPLKLVKIHRLLDHYRTPDYVVQYIVYHEMLHSQCAPYVNERGMTIVHTPEFKKRERDFRFFRQAQKWIKQNKTHYFI